MERAIEGDWVPQQHSQPPVQPPTPYSTDLKTSTKLGVTSTSSKSSVAGTPPQTSWTLQKTAERSLQHSPNASVTLHIILLGVGGTIYNTHTLKPFKKLGVDTQRVKKLASKLHVHSVNFAAKLAIPDVPFPVLLSTLIRSRFQAKPATLATLLIPINLPFPFRGGGALLYSVPKWLLYLN